MIPRPKFTNKVWGYEALYENNKYCVKLLSVEQGKSCSIHYHKEKTETFCSVRGKVLLEVWDTVNDEKTLKNIALQLPKMRIILEPSSIGVVTIEPFTPHRFTGLSKNNAFYEASTIDKAEDSYRIIESAGLYFDIQKDT